LRPNGWVEGSGGARAGSTNFNTPAGNPGVIGGLESHRRSAYRQTGVRPISRPASVDDAAQMKHNSETSQPMPASVAAPGARILVVDDDALLCGLHAAVLELAGYNVTTANDGADALTQLAGERFDLVLTDHLMPCLDGASLILAMRSAGCRIPVVMICSPLSPGALPPKVAGEIRAVLPKPARAAEILDAVACALAPSLLAAA
jgi:CheY-like chemotaxis protein